MRWCELHFCNMALWRKLILINDTQSIDWSLIECTPNPKKQSTSRIHINMLRHKYQYICCLVYMRYSLLPNLLHMVCYKRENDRHRQEPRTLFSSAKRERESVDYLQAQSEERRGGEESSSAIDENSGHSWKHSLGFAAQALTTRTTHSVSCKIKLH